MLIMRGCPTSFSCFVIFLCWGDLATRFECIESVQNPCNQRQTGTFTPLERHRAHRSIGFGSNGAMTPTFWIHSSMMQTPNAVDDTCKPCFTYLVIDQPFLSMVIGASLTVPVGERSLSFIHGHRSKLNSVCRMKESIPIIRRGKAGLPISI